MFSASQDGSLCVFSLADRDPKKKIADLPQIHTSTEYLTPKMELDELLGQIVNLTTAIKQENTNAQYLADTLKAKHDRKITELNNTKKEKESNAKL